MKISDFGLAFDGHWAHDQAYFDHHLQSLMKRLGVQAESDDEGKKESKGKRISNYDTFIPNDIYIDQKLKLERGEHLLLYRNQYETRRLARNIVGTSEYMAPKVLRGETYDGRCDWWSIGIILYKVNSRY